MDEVVLRPYARKLWTPGQVIPTGIPKINWGHPLTQKLISYWFPFADTGYIDLVSGDVTKKGTGARNLLPVATITSYGTGPGLVATTTLCESTNLASVQAWAFPYSYACGWYQLGTLAANAFPFWFGIADASGNSPLGVFSPSAGNMTWNYGNAGGGPTIAVTNNTFYVAVGAATAASTEANYLNGIVRTAGAVSATFSGSNLRYVFGAGSADAAENTTNLNSLVFFGAVWNGRALTAADATTLYADPYCFLVPDRPEMMIIQAAAVAAQDEQLNWTIYRRRSRGWGH